MSCLPRTNRTEFARWVDANPDAIPQWEEWRVAYFKKFRYRDAQFGQFVRSKYKLEFVEVYEDFWLKRPDLWSGKCNNMDGLAHALTRAGSIA